MKFTARFTYRTWATNSERSFEIIISAEDEKEAKSKALKKMLTPSSPSFGPYDARANSFRLVDIQAK